MALLCFFLFFSQFNFTCVLLGFTVGVSSEPHSTEILFSIHGQVVVWCTISTTVKKLHLWCNATWEKSMTKNCMSKEAWPSCWRCMDIESLVIHSFSEGLCVSFLVCIQGNILDLTFSMHHWAHVALTVFMNALKHKWLHFNSLSCWLLFR